MNEKQEKKNMIIVWYGGIIGKVEAGDVEEAKEKLREGKGTIEPLGGHGDFSYEMYYGEKKEEYKEKEKREGKIPRYAGMEEWAEIFWRRYQSEEMINKALIERETRIINKIMKEARVKYIRVFGIYEEESGEILDWEMVRKDMEKDKETGDKK